MASALQIANSFVTEFFERLAKNPAGLAELYGRNSVLHIHDFELGIKEVSDADAPAAAQDWAAFVQGSQLRVESVSAAALYSGVNVFVTFTAVGELQQYFHVLTTLEAHTGFNVEGYYIRHQVISRIGAIALEAPPAEEVPVAEEPVEAAAEELPEEALTPLPPAEEKEEEEEKEKEKEKDEEDLPAPEEAAKPEQAPAAKVSKAKSWASLLSSSPKGGIENNKPIRVVASSGAGGAAVAKETSSPAAAKKAGASAVKASPKEYVKREKRPAEAVGDRLMFTIDSPVTEEEVKAALGSMGASLLSLRINSVRGLVFMDFAPDVKAYEELRKLGPVIGPNKTKINVFHQHARQ